MSSASKRLWPTRSVVGTYSLPHRGEKKSHKSAESNSGGMKWGMTKSAEQIERDWKKWPDANVGIPTGEINGFFVVETDTKAGHGDDGAAALAELEAQPRSPLQATLMARLRRRGVDAPATSSTRVVKVWNSHNHIAPGVDSRGDGGMVIALEVFDRPETFDPTVDPLVRFLRRLACVKSFANITEPTAKAIPFTSTCRRAHTHRKSNLGTRVLRELLAGRRLQRKRSPPLFPR